MDSVSAIHIYCVGIVVQCSSGYIKTVSLPCMGRSTLNPKDKDNFIGYLEFVVYMTITFRDHHKIQALQNKQ